MNIEKIKKKFSNKLRPYSFLFPYSSLSYLSSKTKKQIDILYFEIFEILKIQNIVECGAREATASIEAIKRGAKAIAIEANPTTFNQVTPKSTDKFTKINIGLSDTSGKLYLYIPKKNTTAGSSTFLPKKKMDFNLVSVPIDTLDQVTKNFDLTSSPFSLWIDVEGMQKQVLLGSKNILKSKNCKFIKIEVEEREFFGGQLWLDTDVENFLYKFNFIPVFLDFERTYQYNIIFVKKDTLEFIKKNIETSFEASVEKDFSFFDIMKFILKCNLLIDLKVILIKFFGKKFGHFVAKILGSKSSKDFLNRNSKE
jgi:FkbM family methyltransferase